jgi:hypothetical protein
MTVPFIRKSTQRNSSWPGEFVLHRKAEYICADLSFALRFSLAVVRRTIHLRNVGSRPDWDSAPGVPWVSKRKRVFCYQSRGAWITSGLNLGASLIFRRQTGLNKGQLTAHIIPPDSLSPRARKHPLRRLMAHIFPRTISRNGSARYGLPTFSTDVPPRAALPVAPMDARMVERIQLG